MEKKNPVHFVGLNALRFFSALVLIIYHGTLAWQDNFPQPIKTFVKNLTLGVDFFFLLSGFLIVYLLLVEKENFQKISLYKFYLRRIVRIFPLYYLVISIAFWQYHVSNPEINFSKFLYFWGNFWMIQTDSWTNGILNPLWSLCVEEHFYLIVPVLVMILPFRWLKYFFASIVIGSLFFRIVATISMPKNWMTIYLHTFSRVDVLAIGAYIACLHKEKPIILSIRTRFLPLLVLNFLIMCCLINFMDYSDIVYAGFAKYLYITPMIGIFLLVIFNQNEHPLIKAVKNNQYISYLGKISFGLYMYSAISGGYLSTFPVLKESALLFPISNIIGDIIVSAISFELFEKQILRIKSYFEVVATKS